MSDTVYIIFVVILLIAIAVQQLYIHNLKLAIGYAIRTMEKLKDALLMDDAIRKVNENESKTNKIIHE